MIILAAFCPKSGTVSSFSALILLVRQGILQRKYGRINFPRFTFRDRPKLRWLWVMVQFSKNRTVSA